MKLHVFIIILIITFSSVQILYNTNYSNTESYKVLDGERNLKTEYFFPTKETNPAPVNEKIEFYGIPIDHLWYNSSSLIIFEHAFTYNSVSNFCWMGSFTDYALTNSSFYLLYIKTIERDEKVYYSTIWVYNSSSLILREHAYFTNISAGDLDGDGSDDIVLWLDNGTIQIIYYNGSIQTINVPNVEIKELWVWNRSLIIANLTNSVVKILAVYPKPIDYEIFFSDVVYARLEEDKISFFGYDISPFIVDLYKNGTKKTQNLNVRYIERCIFADNAIVFYNNSGFTYYNGSSWNFSGTVDNIFYANGYIFVVNDTVTAINTRSMQSKKLGYFNISVIYYNDTFIGLRSDGALYDLFSGSFLGFLRGVGRLRIEHYYDRIIIFSDHDVAIINPDASVKWYSFNANIESVFVSKASTVIKTKDGYLHLLNGTELYYPDATFAYLGKDLLVGLSNGTVIIGSEKLYVGGRVVFITYANDNPIITTVNENITHDVIDYAKLSITIHNLTPLENHTIYLKCSAGGISSTSWILKIMNYENIIFGVALYNVIIEPSPGITFYFKNYTMFVFDGSLKELNNNVTDSEVFIKPFWGGDSPVFSEVTIESSMISRFVIYSNETFINVSYEGEIPIWVSMNANITDEKLRYSDFVIDFRDAIGVLASSNKVVIIKDGRLFVLPYSEDLIPPEITYLGDTIFAENNVTLEFYCSDNIDLERAEITVGEETFYYELSGNESYVKLSSKLEEGVYSVLVRVFDLFGNKKEISFKIYVDTSPPIINLLYPRNGSVINESIIRPEFEVFDVLNYTVEIYVDGTVYNGSSLCDGNHLLEIFVRDSLGRSSSVKAIFEVDTKTPQIKLLRFKEYYNTSNVSIKLSVNEECKITVRVDGSEVEANSTLNLTEGVHELEVIAIDKAGNVAKLKKTFVVDLTVPEIYVEPSNETVLVGNIKLKINTTDNFGISLIRVYLDDKLVYEGDSGVLEVELDEGVHYFSVIAIDLAGNVKVIGFYLKAVNGVKIMGTIVEYSTLSFIVSFFATILTFFSYKKRDKLKRLLRWKLWKR